MNKQSDSTQNDKHPIVISKGDLVYDMTDGDVMFILTDEIFSGRQHIVFVWNADMPNCVRHLKYWLVGQNEAGRLKHLVSCEECDE